MSKHTPTPWVMRPAVCRHDHPETSADVQGPNGQFVADCGCHDQATANAERIVLAVNLHDELVEKLSHMRWCQTCAEGWSQCDTGREAEALLANGEPSGPGDAGK